MTYTQDQADQAAARYHAAALAAEHARQCACGAAGAIMMHKIGSWRGHWTTIPACGPCAIALEACGWSPEREEA